MSSAPWSSWRYFYQSTATTRSASNVPLGYVAYTLLCRAAVHWKLVSCVRLTPIGDMKSCMYPTWFSPLVLPAQPSHLSVSSLNSPAGWSRWSWLSGQRRGSATSQTRDQRWVPTKSKSSSWQGLTPLLSLFSLNNDFDVTVLCSGATW